jgi:hypothetical protein
MRGVFATETRREAVIPAQAGIHPSEIRAAKKWVPAFAGTTV